ncbi:hypothetical protein FN846DRAFT_908776 [Sphaerosporella brunnea]|uniref:Uncharacterized protein n=1 Tax=Sphaerosporella brunnea TaxID=1250544 RepID=A0A5J5ES41_9PEZI|nr:hypothetical protein FN846DRAFT_908776 [Sphaerosporella brunnea]
MALLGPLTTNKLIVPRAATGLTATSDSIAARPIRPIITIKFNAGSDISSHETYKVSRQAVMERIPRGKKLTGSEINAIRRAFNNENDIDIGIIRPKKPIRPWDTQITLKFDDGYNIWTAVNFKVGNFDLSDGGKITVDEIVHCDEDECGCVATCDCDLPQWTETKLFCDGTFTQEPHHGAEEDDEDAMNKCFKHNVSFKPCGSDSCLLCDGLKLYKDDYDGLRGLEAVYNDFD